MTADADLLADILEYLQDQYDVDDSGVWARRRASRRRERGGEMTNANFKIISNGKSLPYPFLRIFGIVTVAYWVGVFLGRLSS